MIEDRDRSLRIALRAISAIALRSLFDRSSSDLYHRSSSDLRDRSLSDRSIDVLCAFRVASQVCIYLYVHVNDCDVRV